jgi:hypothetical protein
MLELLAFGLQVHNLLLQSHDAGPLLLHESFISLCFIWAEIALGHVEVIADGLGGFRVAGGVQIGDDALVSVSASSAKEEL